MDTGLLSKAKDSGVNAGTENAPAISPDVKSNSASKAQSWGDKYSAKAYHGVRNILANYIVNFAVSAIAAYAVLKSPIEKKLFKPFINDYAAPKLHEKFGIDEKFGQLIGGFFTRTQLLLTGGRALTPFMKWTHDNRKRLEFRMGHELDLLQEFTGRGNTASKQNIEEYSRVSSLLSVAKHNRKEKNPIAVTINESDKALLEKYGINDNLQFNEHKKSWKQILKARGLGEASTTTLSVVLATSSYLGEKKGLPWINVEKGLEFGGKAFGQKLLNGLKKFGVNDSAKMGELVILELIYTLFSKLGFDHMEKKQQRREIETEKAAAAARLEHDEMRVEQDKNTLASFGTKDESLTPGISFASRTPAKDPKALLQKGEQDFRTRETTKPTETSLAMS